MCEYCKDEKDPCCWDKRCVASSFGMCECCGAEMFEERGFWFHHSQSDIPFNERRPQHPPEKSKAKK